jgi:hypothetical protein
MSDFDKEAEREKLREKFERDRQKRQETERMSQLLLQGATMTNRHCDTCGDPLFRYQGQVFCATCQGRAEEGDAAAPANGSDASVAADPADATAGAGTETGDGGDADATTAESGAASPEAVDADAAGHPIRRPDAAGSADAGAGAGNDGAAASDADAAGHPDGQSPAEESPGGATGSEQSPAASASPAPAPGAAGGEGAGAAAGEDLTAARASLVRTLTRAARAAESADGPRRAADHLSVVREAAEALRALDRVRTGDADADGGR